MSFIDAATPLTLRQIDTATPPPMLLPAMITPRAALFYYAGFLHALHAAHAIRCFDCSVAVMFTREENRRRHTACARERRFAAAMRMMRAR